MKTAAKFGTIFGSFAALAVAGALKADARLPFKSQKEIVGRAPEARWLAKSPKPEFGGIRYRMKDSWIGFGLGFYARTGGSGPTGITPAMAMLSAYSGTLVDEVGGYEGAHTRASHATVTDFYGWQTFAGNNLFLNSATLSTQNVTTVAGNYIISFKGTGTITLTGTSTAGPIVGTGVGDRVYLKITPTVGTLTCTVSGSVTNARISRVTYETTPRAVDDVETTGAAYYALRIQHAPDTLETSSTSLTIGSGSSYAFTTDASHSFAVGDVVRATDNADPDNWLWGYVTAASGTSVTLATYTFPGTAYSRPVRTNGSGTISDWSLIRVDGYLPEPAATNLYSYSTPDTTNWTENNVDLLENDSGTLSPSGTQTATFARQNSATSQHAFFAIVSVSTGVDYVFQIDVKNNGTTQWIQIATSTGFAVGPYINFDTVNGVFGNVDTFTSGEYGVIPLSNGWLRIWATATATSTTAFGNAFVLGLLQGDTASRLPTYSGDGSSGVHVDNANIMEGTVPSSPIITKGSPVARAADVDSLSTATWWNGSGTFFTRAKTPAVGDLSILKLNDGTANEVIDLYTSGTNPLLQITDGGSTQLAPLDLGTVTADTFHDYAIRIATNNVNGALDGTAVTADTTATLPTVTALSMGEHGGVAHLLYFTSEEIDSVLETGSGG